MLGMTAIWRVLGRTGEGEVLNESEEEGGDVMKTSRHGGGN